MKILISVLTLFALRWVAFSQTPRSLEAACSTYFAVMQDDPTSSARYFARMSGSQAKWYAKNGTKQYPGLCLSLEKAEYLIVWRASTQSRTINTTQTRTAQVNTTTMGQENGTFSAYGSLSLRGTYSETSSSFSTTTIRYQESVPVTISADHCYAFVLKSVGPTVWDDISHKTPQPPLIFSTDARGHSKVSNGTPDITTSLAVDISYLVKREPTTHALNDALKFISVQPPALPGLPAPQAPSGSSATTHSPVSFKSNPVGADITVDGKYVGSTPSIIPLGAGDHDIEIWKPGFKAWKRKISVIGGGKVTIDATLEKAAPQ